MLLIVRAANNKLAKKMIKVTYLTSQDPEFFDYIAPDGPWICGVLNGERKKLLSIEKIEAIKPSDCSIEALQEMKKEIEMELIHRLCKSCDQERDEDLDEGWCDNNPRINVGLGFSYGGTIA